MTEVIDLNGNKKILIEIPNICPYCQKGIKPVIVNSIKENFHEHLLLYVTFKCPICEELFLGNIIWTHMEVKPFLNLVATVFILLK